MNEWISVKDRLPEIDGMVLAHIKYPQPFGGCDTAIDVRYYGAVMYKPGWVLVTHWMPLPDPPGKDAKQERHGTWIPISDGDMCECSECGTCLDGDFDYDEFCKCNLFCCNCGTKMDGGI